MTDTYSMCLGILLSQLIEILAAVVLYDSEDCKDPSRVGRDIVVTVRLLLQQLNNVQNTFVIFNGYV